ncbi:MAG: hypothetical protein ACI4RF_06245, partial [Eubacterium sp.]
IETAHVRKFTFKFDEDNKSVKITNDMTPRLQDLVIYYMTFTGMPIRSEITEDAVKAAVKTLGLPIVEPDFKGKFED